MAYTFNEVFMDPVIIMDALNVTQFPSNEKDFPVPMKEIRCLKVLPCTSGICNLC